MTVDHAAGSFRLEEEGERDPGLGLGLARDVDLIGEGDHERKSQAPAAMLVVFVEAGLEGAVVGDFDYHSVR